MFHADSSAAILQDGRILFAVAEERLNRRKHYGGFPALAVKAVWMLRARRSPTLSMSRWTGQ